MKIQLRDRVLAYDDSGGPRPPLVLIHGFPLDRTIWAAQVRDLADVARVIAPDLRGFGESTLPQGSVPSAMSMDDYAHDVLALLDALELPAVVLGGVSMGGYVAMAVQRLAPQRLRALLLVGTRAGPDSTEARAARDAAAALARAEGAPAIAAQMLDKMLTPGTARANQPLRRALSELMSAQPVQGLLGALAAMRDRADSRSSVTRLAVPTLVVCGAEDTLIPPSESAALQAAIPGARLELLASAAHLPNYEQPAAFNRVIRSFLTDLRPTAG